MICQVCKGLSSSQRLNQVTHLRAPLDSTALDAITPSPKSMRAVKQKTYQDSTFPLSIPLELDDDDLDSLNLDPFFLIMLASTCSA